LCEKKISLFSSCSLIFDTNNSGTNPDAIGKDYPVEKCEALDSRILNTAPTRRPDAIAICEPRLFDLTTKDDQLLTKESIFNQQVSSTAANVGKCAQSQ
jgi:hypothetical protein